MSSPHVVICVVIYDAYVILEKEILGKAAQLITKYPPEMIWLSLNGLLRLDTQEVRIRNLKKVQFSSRSDGWQAIVDA